MFWKKFVVVIVVLSAHILFYNFLTEGAGTSFFVDALKMVDNASEFFFFVLKNLGTTLCEVIIVSVIGLFYAGVCGAWKILGLE